MDRVSLFDRAEAESWREVLRTRSGGRAAEAELVLLAVGVRVVRSRDGIWHRLDVPAAHVDHARRQLLLHRLENRSPPPRPAAPIVDDGVPGVAGYLAAILLVPLVLRLSGAGAELIDAGLLAAGPFRDGEFWRATTALTLHGDMAHLAGNALFGAVFGGFLGRLVGSGVGWLAVLLAATLANMVNGSIQADVFRSLGASTATFAALGLVGAVTALRQQRRVALPTGMRPFRDWGPLLAAVGLLAFTGSGGGPDSNTDVAAHLFGFLFGGVAGFLLVMLRLDRITARSRQAAAGVVAAALVCSAWLLAALGGTGPEAVSFTDAPWPAPHLVPEAAA